MQSKVEDILSQIKYEDITDKLDTLVSSTYFFN
jgi:hypothetical protein